MGSSGKSSTLILFVFFCLITASYSLKQHKPTLVPSKIDKSSFKNFFELKANLLFVYHGTVDIQITDGNQNSLDFFIGFAPIVQCNWTKCFKGWVFNYTQNEEETVNGYPNGNQETLPVFQFNTKTEQQFQIKRSPNLQQVWAQIIQLSCEKLNPQLIKNSTLNQQGGLKSFSSTPQSSNNVKYKFQVKKNQEVSDLQNNFWKQQNLKSLNEGLQISKVFQQFKTSPNFKVMNAQKGQFLTTSAKILSLSDEDIQIKKSAVRQQIILNQKLQVKQRLINYDISLKSDPKTTEQGQQIPDFAGRILIGLNLVQQAKVSISTLSQIKEYLKINTNKTFSFMDIQKRRKSQAISLNSQKQPESYDLKIIDNNSGKSINSISQSLLIPKSGKFAGLQSFSSSQLSSTGGLSSSVQSTQTFSIYDYYKTLFTQTIFGKKFETSIQIQCDLITSSSHKIKCLGKIIYKIFSKSKQITVFNFYKTVKTSWNESKKFSGSWGSSIYIPLPAPVSFLGLNFAFNIGFVIELSLSSKTYQGTPYKIVVKAEASSSVTTGASAAVRAIAIEGGVFIQGTLVKLKTDPTLSLSYYDSSKKIVAKIQWFLYIYGFQYEWGFFYRYWKFWSGWSGKKIIAKWTINGVYSKTTLLAKNWNINY